MADLTRFLVAWVLGGVAGYLFALSENVRDNVRARRRARKAGEAVRGG